MQKLVCNIYKLFAIVTNQEKQIHVFNLKQIKILKHQKYINNHCGEEIDIFLIFLTALVDTNYFIKRALVL